MASRWQRAIVVGASSGIGEAIARRLTAQGCRTALLARRGDELERVVGEIEAATEPGRAIHRAHDVTEFDAVPALYDELEEALGGRVDLLVYAAGIMPAVEASEYTFEKDRSMIEVNLLGAIAWCNQAALRMEEARGGSILGVSSIAGDRGRRGAPVYNTSKAALNTYLEALRNRLWQHGVRVTTVRPGFVDTVMTKDLDSPLWLISADRAAQLMLEAARREKTDVYVPARWGLVGLVIRNIPSFLFRKTSI